jgi:hypothetical protein
VELPKIGAVVALAVMAWPASSGRAAPPLPGLELVNRIWTETDLLLVTIAGTPVWKRPGPPIAIVFRAGMAIDVDGAPTAYHAHDGLGLNSLTGAGRPGHWWGIVTKDNRPIVQGPRDLAPGYYVSMTSLQNPAFRETDPRRYVDASKIPYVVLPKSLTVAAKIKLGDIVAIVNQANEKVVFAIYADQGPKDKLGEGSLYLANQLRTKPLSGRSAVRRSLRDRILYVIFPGSGNGRPKSREEIARIGAELFERWGGTAAVEAFGKASEITAD